MSVAFSLSRGASKRMLAASVVGLLVASSIALIAAPAQAATSGFTAANGIRYGASDVDGTITAIGYDGSALTVEIPDTVTEAGAEYTVTAIGAEAFKYWGLTGVIIGQNVKTIGQMAFSRNSVTGPIIIPASVQTIEDDAFSSSGTLTSLDIPASVTHIGEAAFGGTSLSSVTLHEGLESIGQYAFWGNPMTAITIPASVQTIGANLFWDGHVVAVTFAGAAPTLWSTDAINPDSGHVDPSLGDAEGLTVHYLSTFGVDGGRANGFTTPTWMGYNTVIDPIVSFDVTGHDAIAKQRLVAGERATAPTVTDAGFDGWFTTADFTTPFDFSVAPTDDVTVYAKWPVAAVVIGEPVVEPVAPSSPTLTLDLGLAVGDVVAGAPVTVSGAGLKAGSDYTVILRSTPVLLAGGTIDSSGAFTASAVLPTGLSAGQHTVTLTGTATDGSSLSRVAFLTVSATGTVTYLSYTAADAATAALAATGFTAAPLGFAALLLLLAGAALVAARRRSVA
ncbi:hypothetical protein E3T46_15760 [Cryobacterium sp. Hh11]|uniref:leucine-rich repeat protein n=1 Tax=Cryobacterium sp. Hh11 TaxID=2555868 RepID=UPI00106A132F|nr:leucine-rich repeat protein [Cryobacterium sp. Hh11]TFD48215.1 hypothetical protein E3T46_15760 [Cryobacterium sp. Hh11]